MLKTSKERTQELIKVALGEAEADLAIINGDILNVYTGEILSQNDILIKGYRIAYVGKAGGKSIGQSTQVIDAAGKTVIPGFIDGHAHIGCEYSMSELMRYAAAGGTTTIITETAEIAFPLGCEGIIEFIKSAKNQPVKVFVTISPMVSVSPVDRTHAIGVKELRRLLRRKEVIGLGESYWAQVIADPRALELIAETIKAGKVVEGHSSGARDKKLQSYVATGVSSCHEPITPDEVVERLRLGLTVLVREGEIRRELEAIAPIKDRNISLRRLAVSSDGLGPWQLIADGYMEFIVQKAVNLGFDPVLAIQMATINVAEHFGLDNFIGGIAPGRYADIIVIPDLRTIRAEYVISNGRIIARKGQLMVKPRNHRYPEWMYKSVNTGNFGAGSLVVRLNGRRQAKVRVIDQVTSLVTREAIVDMPVLDGCLRPDADRDIVKIAAIERTYQPGKTFTGFIRGLGLKRGAIATSMTWDSSMLIVVGANDADMVQAVNRVKELYGGIVICNGGRVLAEIAFPVGGVISTEPMETIARKLYEIQKVAAGLGCTSPDIRITLATLSSSAIAHIRICEQGLFNLRENKFVDLIVDADGRVIPSDGLGRN